MRCTDWNSFKNLIDVRNSLTEFLYKNYINEKHSSTKQTPNERCHNEFDKVTYLEEKHVNESFLHRTKNKVRKDRTISFRNSYYEVPFKYVGQTIELRYDPLNMEVLYLYEDEKYIE